MSLSRPPSVVLAQRCAPPVSVRALCALAFLVGTTLWGRPSAAQVPGDDAPTEWEQAEPEQRVVWGDAPSEPLANHGRVGSRWYQILSSPHIGASLTHVAVDPTNPNQIYVGTEESTVLRSEDGGITWTELATGPLQSTGRDVPPPLAPGLRHRAETAHLVLVPKEPFRPSSLYTTAIFAALPFIIPWADVRPDLLRAFISTPGLFTRGPGLLTRTLSRRHQTNPVDWISVCPGSEFSLLVAAADGLYGSQDRGESFVRLHGSTGSVRARITRLWCDAARPGFIVAGSSDGVLVSHDSGVTFLPEEQIHSSRINAITSTENGALLIAVGRALYRLDTDGEVDTVYRLFGDNDFAHIVVDGTTIWAGTEHGLHVSSDDGRSWAPVAPNRLDQFHIPVVRVGHNDAGGRRIAVVARFCPGNVTRFGSRCRSTEVLYSDDEGHSWNPFFLANTRRSVQAIEQVSTDGEDRWLMLTSGELFTSSVLGRTVLGPETRAWARQRLAETPTLESVLDDGLRRLALQRDDLADFEARRRLSALVPRFTARFQMDIDNYARASVTGPNPLYVAENSASVVWSFDCFVRWNFANANNTQSRSARLALWELRQRVSYLLEDAWHERRLHLERLTLGTEDLLQAEILRERILALEAVIDFWVGRDISADLSDFPEAF